MNDDELRQRLRRLARDVETRAAGRSGGVLDRARRRRQRSVVAQTAAAVVLTVLAATAVPAWLGGGADAPLPALASGDPTPGRTPGDDPTYGGDDPNEPGGPNDPPSHRPPTPSYEPTAPASPRPSTEPTELPASPTPSQPPKTLSPSPDRWTSRCDVPGRAPTTPAGVEVTVTVTEPVVSNGDDVHLAVRFRNNGPHTLSYQHGSNYYDFVVVDAVGVPRWVFSHFKAYTAELRSAQHPPGTDITANGEWTVAGCAEEHNSASPKLAAGQYRVYGLWAGDGGFWWSNPVPLTVR